MTGKMILRPGTPDDDNREYLPEKIKGSDIVVNENGNNSQPYPERLKECHGVIADNIEDEWYEYVPESYDPSKKTPLVLSMHGGLMTGWGQAIYTSWTMAADRDGFILVFPNASENRVWQVQWGKWESDPNAPGPDTNTETPDGIRQSPDNVDENHDVHLALGLIERMKEKYNIDAGRIFMQGMSMGNMMTSLFARNFGNVLAGAAGSGCASFLSLLFDENEKIKNRTGHLAVWQSRPELNDIPPEKGEALKVNKYNRLYWMRLNECGTLPEICIRGENNFAFYKGRKADLVYLDIKNRDHGQSFDDAALIWDYFFSGLRRESDGTIRNIGSVKERCVRNGCRYAEQKDLPALPSTTIKVTSVVLRNKEISLEVGETAALSVTVLPFNATNQKIHFKSVDPSMVSVSADGILTGVSDGEIEVYVISDENSSIMDSCKIKVTNPFAFDIFDAYSYELVAYNGKKKDVDIPENYKGKPVVKIGQLAFEAAAAVRPQALCGKQNHAEKFTVS